MRANARGNEAEIRWIDEAATAQPSKRGIKEALRAMAQRKVGTIGVSNWTGCR